MYQYNYCNRLLKYQYQGNYESSIYRTFIVQEIVLIFFNIKEMWNNTFNNLLLIMIIIIIHAFVYYSMISFITSLFFKMIVW